jgi:hypothetical protein
MSIVRMARFSRSGGLRCRVEHSSSLISSGVADFMVSSTSLSVRRIAVSSGGNA